MNAPTCRFPHFVLTACQCRKHPARCLPFAAVPWHLARSLYPVGGAHGQVEPVPGLALDARGTLENLLWVGSGF